MKKNNLNQASNTINMLKKGVFLDKETKKHLVSKISSKAPSISKSALVENAINLMLEGSRRLPVIDKSGNVHGIVTTTDIVDFLGGGGLHSNFLSHKRPVMQRLEKIMRPCECLQSDSSVEEALGILLKSGRGGMPVLKKGSFSGMVRDSDFLRLVECKRLKVEDLMTEKPFRLEEGLGMFEAARIMINGGLRRHPVTSNGILTGILTPMDIIKFLRLSDSLEKMKEEKTQIREIMERNVVSISPTDSVERAVQKMLSKKIGGLPVTEDTELEGIITERDILRAVQ